MKGISYAACKTGEAMMPFFLICSNQEGFWAQARLWKVKRQLAAPRTQKQK